MKKLRIVLGLTMLTLLSACGIKGIDVSKLLKSEYNAADQSKEIVMALNDTTIAADTETLKVHFTSSSAREYTFGMEPRLEVESEGTWYIVTVKEDAVWIEIAVVLPAGETADIEFPLQTFYGKLSAGHYRIVKPLYSEGGSTFAIAEFTVQ